MNAGFYTFDQIIEEIKLATGMSNMRNLYDDIEKMICHAEREINPYAGHLVKKRMIFWKGGPNFDGKIIKKPIDYVAIDSVGSCKDGLCPNQYRETTSHIIICDNVDREKIIWTYWGYQTDSNGRIITTRNHASAVIEWILYNFARQRYHMRQGSLNDVNFFKESFYLLAAEARGADFFPTNLELEMMKQVDEMDPAVLQNLKTGVDCCISKECLYTFEDKKPDEPIDGNTPPTVSDNSAKLQYLYNFSFNDFTKDYEDLQNHPPGKWIVDGPLNSDLGKLYFGQNTTSPLVVNTFPFEKGFNEVNNLYFKLNSNVIIYPDGSVVSYEGVQDIELLKFKFQSEGYEFIQNGYDLVFRKEETTSQNTKSDFFVFVSDKIKQEEIDALKTNLQNFYEIKKTENNFYIGNFYFIVYTGENWLQMASVPMTGQLNSLEGNLENSILPENFNSSLYEPSLNPLVLIVNLESHPVYHSEKVSDGFGVVEQPTLAFTKDFDSFYKNFNGDVKYESFKGLLLTTTNIDTSNGHFENPDRMRAFILHAIAAMEGKILSPSEIADYNLAFNIDILLSENPYEDYSLPGYSTFRPLYDLGFSGVFDKTTSFTQLFLDDPTYQTFEVLFEDLTPVTTETKEVIISGTVHPGTISFPFKVKEDSVDQLESNQQTFSFISENKNDYFAIYSFQFNSPLLDIEDASYMITEEFISQSAIEHTLTSMMAGKLINFYGDGRHGFILRTNNENEYKILDESNTDITSDFNRIYISEKKLEIYLIKDLPIKLYSSIFYKFAIFSDIEII